ncbi:WD repeat-containing protein 25 [Biomphalaria glabrata]|nr:WD repeat-containing protein 25 [Biomphalaria glabrata]
MENLKYYESDNDSNETNQTTEQDLQSNHCKSIKNETLSFLSTAEIPVENESDFFGFKALSTTGRTKLNGSETQMCAHIIDSKYGAIEIPDGDFWKDVTLDSVQDNDRGESSAFAYNNTETNNSSRFSLNCTPKYSNSLQIPSHKRSYGWPFSNADDYPGKIKIAMVTLKSAFVRQDQPVVHSTDNDNKLTFVKKKMYYVHSKVSPYLNTKICNKCSTRLEKSWIAHDGVVNRLAWNISCYSHLLATAGMDAVIRVWNVWSSTESEATLITCHKKAVTHVDWCMNGLKILTCSYDRTAQITDVETGQCTALCEHVDFVTSACLHPSNGNIFVTGTDNMMCMWDVRTPQAPTKHFNFKDNIGQIQDVLFISNGQEIISCGDVVSRDSADRSIMAWDVRSGVVLSNQIFQERYTCTRLKLHPDNTHFLAQTQGGYVAIFSTTSPYKLDKSKRFEGHKIQGYRIGFDISPSGKILYSGSSSGGVYCYDEHSGRSIRQLNLKQDVITDVACHPVLSSMIAASTWGGSIYLWH